ncbi:AP endonuclease (DNA-[apurinic or apyrimidinic site] lyase) [Plasmodium gonderi]|uniref:AP endonuclease (DNA-[apurinic or apyrimidinic site] lyase) n=1 Tax=Plasmodium gonderi TaxID=77519 RepID=A0A1Y1JIY3_PLAGO|nr:AP endonuclease (DNA-[apurinic or apyrimidinic site] lyase) [Plasmodium gonderi]GAW80762.1 AP endonuclease (DNA-[apurinic or apyrimidinic site] lyase) [Plasmodium gonderi]
MLRSSANIITRCMTIKILSNRSDIAKFAKNNLCVKHFKVSKVCTSQVKMLGEIQLNKRKQNEDKEFEENYERNKRTKLVPSDGLSDGKEHVILKGDAHDGSGHTSWDRSGDKSCNIQCVQKVQTAQIKSATLMVVKEKEDLDVNNEEANATNEKAGTSLIKSEMDEHMRDKYKVQENPDVKDTKSVTQVHNERVEVKEEEKENKINNNSSSNNNRNRNNCNLNLNENGEFLNETKEEIKRIVTWNMNSITVRHKNKEKWNNFMNFFHKINADVWCFQEVRLPALNLLNGKIEKDDKRDRSKVKNTDQKSQIDFEIIENILKKDFTNYNAYFSLANIKYSGQLVLIKKSIPVKSIRYNLFFDKDPNIHHDEGRVILVGFSNFYLLSTYTPNNGFDMVKFERRRLFDVQLKEFVSDLKKKNQNLIWTGDLNIAPEDIDLSHPAEFRRMKKGNVPKEFIGQPGCTDFERKNFKNILSAGDLIDSYRYLANLKKKAEEVDIKKNGTPINNNKSSGKSTINENIYTWRCPFQIGKSCNKAMRIDHFIISRDFMPKVEKVDIHGYGVFHNNFYGSDHCPVILHLHQ